MQRFLTRQRLFNRRNTIPVVLLVFLLAILLLTGFSIISPYNTTSDTEPDASAISQSGVLVGEYDALDESVSLNAQALLLPKNTGTWSSVNFLITLMSLLAAMVLLLVFISRTIISESPKISVPSCFMGIISGVIILVLFISTQNLRRLAGLFDEYTSVTLILFVIQLVLIRLTFSKTNHRKDIS
jgi:magnesium-transporting ATPase (P-type)